MGYSHVKLTRIVYINRLQNAPFLAFMSNLKINHRILFYRERAGVLAQPYITLENMEITSKNHFDFTWPIRRNHIAFTSI